MKRIFSSIVLLICAMIAHAQSPDIFNYQAVARDAGGNVLPNTNVAVRLTIRDVTTGGTILYRERHAVLTNQFGLFTCQVGTGTLTSGSFTTINWADSSKFLQVEFDPTGGLSYTDMGTTQLVSVPYAKVADAINMFPSGTSNPDKMIITHSPAYPGYGLQYQDASDKFNFLYNNTSVLTVDLGGKSVGIGTSSPSSPLHVKGVFANQADTGMATFNNTGTGSAIYASGTGTATATGAAINAENKNAGTAVFGGTTGAGWAIYGYNPSGVAGHFSGDVEVTSNSYMTGYTQLGTGAPVIKMKKLTGTSPAAQGSNSAIAHGLNSSKILSVTALLETSPGNYIPPHYNYIVGSQFEFYVSSTDIGLVNVAANSYNILSKPVRVLVTYEE